MISYCALAILAVLVGANAQSTQPCSKQIELEHRCMQTIETSPEAGQIKDRKHDIIKQCAPDMPTDCHAQFQAAHDCAVSIGKTMDSDPAFAESKSKSQPAVDECFVKYPPDVRKGFEEIFMMMKPPHKMHKRFWHHKKNNDSSSEESSGGSSAEMSSGENESNETSSFERKHHGGGGRGGGGRGGGGRGGHGGHGGRGGHGGHGGRGGRGGHGRHCRPGHGGRGGHGGHHGPRNFTENDNSSSSSSSSSSSESKENNTSSSSSKESGEKKWKHHGQERPECRKTPEQMKCMKEEFKKLGQDAAFIDVMNTLIRQKKKCKQIVDWSCSAKCPKRQRCIFKATKPCRDAFMQRFKTCMTDKGFTMPPFMHGDATEMFTTPLPVISH